jgi:hypothetical protein
MRISWLFVALLAIACSPRPSEDHTITSTTNSLKPIATVLATHTPEWMKIPGVVGIGETKKDTIPAIMIMVDTLTDSLRNSLPSIVEGYSIVIEQAGKITPLSR